jgi:isopenicillin-N N-acyltransferase-like protein
MGIEEETETAMKLHPLTTHTDPEDRGRAIGTAYGDYVRATSARYLRHFELLGVPSDRVRAIVENSSAALRNWAPALAVESDAIARAAGLATWRVAAVGARTEVLAVAPSAGEGECSTAVRLPEHGAPETIQTWDWHDELATDAMLLQLTTQEGRGVKLFTEFGTAAKIGVNDGGLGLHFNILSHRSDNGDGGVPVHAIARRILEEATTVDDAHAIATSATVSASTVLTVATYHDGMADAASIEMSPAGVAVVRAGDDGWLLHTNHFLAQDLREDDTADDASTTHQRFDHVSAVRGKMAGLDPVGRSAAFAGAAGAAAAICVRPDTAKPLQEQWGTLLTIAIDIPGFGLDYREATPDEAAALGLKRF